MEQIKKIFKRLLPSALVKPLRPIYHGLAALAANFYFGRPSNKLVVIGVTGTNGKSTTVNLIAKILEVAGKKVGYTSTVTLKIAGREQLNNLKMTMPSGWLLHRWLRAMVDAGCQYAILEVSSEGLAQNRHLGINFDAAVFTNLTPEHLDSHGGFEAYKLAKARLFASLTKFPVSIRQPADKVQINPKLQKTIVVNADDQAAEFYNQFQADRHLSYGVKNRQADFVATDIRYSPDGIGFNLIPLSDGMTQSNDRVKSLIFNLNLKGQFDVYNSLAAIAVAQSQNIGLEICQKALAEIAVVPGRVEVLQREPVTLVVDYAYEPEEMRQLYETVSRWPHRKVIQVLGPTGGGRDKARIKILGEMAAKFAQTVYVTTDDPYDEDPKILGQQMAEAAAGCGKIFNQDLFCEYDRRQAIRLALQKAQSGDLVLITGKGADQKMALAAGMYVDWDDREVAKEELKKLELKN